MVSGQKEIAMSISSIGPSHRHIPQRTDAVETTQPAAPEQRGKSADSVGHRAKAAIAAAENGDLPSNIQGQVASAIARSIDFTALLAVEGTDLGEAGDLDTIEPLADEISSITDEVTSPGVTDILQSEATTDEIAKILLNDATDDDG